MYLLYAVMPAKAGTHLLIDASIRWHDDYRASKNRCFKRWDDGDRHPTNQTFSSNLAGFLI